MVARSKKGGTDPFTLFFGAQKALLLEQPRSLKKAGKMKIHDIRMAVAESTDNENSALILSLALQTVLPILKRIARRQKFWLRWGMNALIKAIEEYLQTVRGVA